MKTKLWMLGAAVAALTSCTQSEVLEIPESRVIGFDSFVGKNSRAVTTIDTDGLTNFWVYCAKGVGTGTSFAEDDEDNNATGIQHFFDAVQVTKSGNTYTYDHKHWQGGKNYRFASYSDGNNVLSSAPTFINDANGNWGLEFTNYAVADKDLIVALPNEISVNEEVTNHTRVNLNFGHMLSRVQFVFYTTITSGQKLRINSFKFNAFKQGTLKATKNGTTETIVWETANQTKGDYVYAVNGTNAYTDVTGTSVSFECYVIPQDNRTLTIDEIVLQTLDANDNVLSTNKFEDVSLALTDANHQSWQPGTIYSYQAEVGSSAHEIHFNAIVDAWKDPSEGDKNIGNITNVDGNNP